VRVDVFLNKVCLFKSRTMAGEAVNRGKVRIDGAEARPSRDVRPGTRIAIDLGTGPLEIEVTALPEGNIPKSTAPDYYRVLQDKRGTRQDF